MPNIFVLGSISVDFSISTKSMPKDGETVVASDFLVALSGSGANQAAICALFGQKAYLIGSIGKDKFAYEHLDTLNKIGVDTSCVTQIDDVATGSVVTIKGVKNSRTLVFGGANHKTDFAKIKHSLETTAKEGDSIIINQEVGKYIVENTIPLAVLLGLKIVLIPTPAYLIEKELYKHVDIIIANVIETQVLTKEKCDTDSHTEKALIRLAETMGKTAVITLSEKGCAVLADRVAVPIFITSKVITVVDKTGAHDAFIGALVSRLASGENLPSAARFATKTSALTCTKKGGYKNFPTSAEVEAFV